MVSQTIALPLGDRATGREKNFLVVSHSFLVQEKNNSKSTGLDEMWTGKAWRVKLPPVQFSALQPLDA
jgi:hypothetical protein